MKTILLNKSKLFPFHEHLMITNFHRLPRGQFPHVIILAELFAPVVPDSLKRN